MARERLSVLSSDEVEALSHAFDRAPPPRALQHSLRLKSLFKIGSFACAMIFLSYAELTHHDTLGVFRDAPVQTEPTWVMLQRFPLAIAIDESWPVPDLTMPTLAVLSLPIAIETNKIKSLPQTVTIRAGDNPSSGDLTRLAATPVKGSTTSGPTGSSNPATKTASTNPLTTLISTIFSGFNQSTPSQTLGALSNKTLQSITSGSTPSGFGGQNFGNKSFGGPSIGSQPFNGFKKG